MDTIAASVVPKDQELKRADPVQTGTNDTAGTTTRLHSNIPAHSPTLPPCDRSTFSTPYPTRLQGDVGSQVMVSRFSLSPRQRHDFNTKCYLLDHPHQSINQSINN